MTTNAEALAAALEFHGRHGHETEQQAAARRVERNARAAAELRRLSAVEAEEASVLAVWRGRVQRLEAERDALLADAKRYRWLKSRPVSCPTVGPDLAIWTDSCGDALRGEEADAAIDAAMQGENTP